MIFPLPPGPHAPGVGVLGGWPVSSWFGGRPNPFTGRPSWHGGMDLVAPRLTPMLAVVAGRVTQGWDPSGGGWWTTLYGADGRRYGYGHADHYAPAVAGTWVNAGDVLAFVDSSGSSTGDHLHFAMALSHAGPWADPYDELQAATFTQQAPEPIPGPIDPPEPLHAPHSPKEALAVHQFWTIKGEPAFYVVGLADTLAGAVTPDGAPATADHLVGGLYVYVFPNPAAFTLAAGTGVAPLELDRSLAHHVPLIEELESLPVVYQAR